MCIVMGQTCFIKQCVPILVREVNFYQLLREEKREFGNMPLTSFLLSPTNPKARDSIQLGYFRGDTNKKSCIGWLVEGESLSGIPS